MRVNNRYIEKVCINCGVTQMMLKVDDMCAHCKNEIIMDEMLEESEQERKEILNEEIW